MAGPITHFEVMKRVYRELRALGVIIENPSKPEIVGILKSIEPDIARRHGNLFEELEKIYMIMTGETVTSPTKNRCIRTACHLILDALWIGHQGDNDKWYEPAADLMVRFGGLKINAPTICLNVKDFDALKTVIEAAILGISKKYLPAASKGPVSFVGFHYSDFRASVYLAAKYAVELSVAFIMLAERNKK